MRRPLIVLFLASIVAACEGVARYGVSDDYVRYNPTESLDVSAERRAHEKYSIVMPPNALFISQQFRPANEAQRDAHLGIDIWGKVGTPVLAAADGTVIDSSYGPMFGNQIVIDHGRDATGVNHVTVYKHLHTRAADVGDRVRRGERIGGMGATGLLGVMVHLHFETREGRSEAQSVAHDPHRYWAGGPGKVTCFDPKNRLSSARFVTTYPVACR